MERPVGDKFKINGCVYVVVEDVVRAGERPCGACAFSVTFCTRIVNVRGWCARRARKDGSSVHFEHFGVDF